MKMTHIHDGNITEDVIDFVTLQIQSSDFIHNS